MSCRTMVGFSSLVLGIYWPKPVLPVRKPPANMAVGIQPRAFALYTRTGAFKPASDTSPVLTGITGTEGAGGKYPLR